VNIKYKLLIIAVAPRPYGAACISLTRVQVSTLAAMTRNYLISWSAPPGTITTELNAAYKGAGVIASSPAAEASSPDATAGNWPSYNRTLTCERYSQLRMSAS